MTLEILKTTNALPSPEIVTGASDSDETPTPGLVPTGSIVPASTSGVLDDVALSGVSHDDSSFDPFDGIAKLFDRILGMLFRVSARSTVSSGARVATNWMHDVAHNGRTYMRELDDSARRVEREIEPRSASTHRLPSLSSRDHWTIDS